MMISTSDENPPIIATKDTEMSEAAEQQELNSAANAPVETEAPTAEKPKKAKKPKKTDEQKAAEKQAKVAEKPAKDSKNGVTRPGQGVTKLVWDTADQLSAAKKEAIERAPLVAALEGKVEVGTIHTQYGRWRKYYGLTETKEARQARLKAVRDAKDAEKAKKKAEKLEAEKAAKAAAEAAKQEPQQAEQATA